MPKITAITNYLSQNVRVPREHVEAELVTITKTGDGGEFNWDKTPAGKVFKIESSDAQPDNAYFAVPYRGYWFYIANNDLQSKSTFMLLMQLFDFRPGR